jgi:hypothetical protein
VAKAATDRKPCSCPACGNPRRHFGERTLRETKTEISEAEIDEMLGDHWDEIAERNSSLWEEIEGTD